MLPDLVYSYNHSEHRNIGRQPALVNSENEDEVFHTLYHNILDNVQPVKYKFKIGDQVRIYSKEIFTVSKTVPRNPAVYKLKDYDGEELKGTFYDKELQKVIKHDDMYEVEKILKKRGKGENVQYLKIWTKINTPFLECTRRT